MWTESMRVDNFDHYTVAATVTVHTVNKFRWLYGRDKEQRPEPRPGARENKSP